MPIANTTTNSERAYGRRPNPQRTEALSSRAMIDRRMVWTYILAFLGNVNKLKYPSANFEGQ